MSRIETRLATEALDAARELARFSASADGAGAIVSFSGIMRPTAKGGEALTGLFLDHYPGMTEASIARIATEVAARHRLIAAFAVHRCGLVLPGETIVFVAAAATHRREAFLAADEMMDRLKTEAMFWKQERSLDGACWIEPSERDRNDVKRWAEKDLGGVKRMAGIDESLTFVPLNIAVVTISDTRDATTDTSGALLAERITGAGHQVAAREIVPDEIEAIRGAVTALAKDPEIDVVITTGGTGFSPRDVTPEAIRPLFRREMDGFSVVFHQASYGTVGLSTLQSRAFAGQVEDMFVFCLPGSTGACKDGWDLILQYELDSRYRPCSLIPHIARLQPTT